METDLRCCCKNVSKSYGRKKVLRNCSLELVAGQLVGLVGENGSGKSTFLRCLLGFEKADKGTISIKGRVGYCPQQDVLNKVYTIREHLCFAESIYQRFWPIDQNYFEILLGKLELDTYLNTRVEYLSGGTCQKVKFLTAILHQPQLLFLDKPYGGFDWRMYFVLSFITTVLVGFLFSFQNIIPLFMGLMFLGFIYGAYGGVIGLLSKDFIVGILFIVLLANLDAGWLQNPVFYTYAQDAFLIHCLPSHYPCQFIFAGVFANKINFHALLMRLPYAALFSSLLFIVVNIKIRGLGGYNSYKK